MFQLHQLKDAKSIEDLAELVNFKPRAITYILYKLTDREKYTQFEIAKRSGGARNILAPTEQLKRLQKNLISVLENHVAELEAKGQRNTPFVHGFVKDRSIRTNAKAHRNKRWVLNLDLRDFFGTINFGRVRGILMKDKNFLLDEKVATVIAQICCHNNALPQGAPTSPIISNIVSRPLDLKLVDLAKRYGCNYTRFADDITFSTNKPDFPEQLAKLSANAAHDWVLGDKLRNAIEKAGFSENPAKTRLQYFKSRQEVTGLVVNKRLNVTREYRKLVRAMLDRLVTTGTFELPPSRSHRNASKRAKKVDSIRQLQGMLGFIDWVDLHSLADVQHSSEKILEHAKNKSHRLEALTSQEKQYRKFLLYRNFFLIDQPLILTEGKTDKTHLSAAAKQLGEKYPDLVDVTQTSRSLKFHIFPSLARRTNALLGLCGGTSDLATFIKSYSTETKSFNKSLIKQPVIVLADKDSGWKSIKGAIKAATKCDADGSESFYYIHANLYVVCIPSPLEKNEGCIEDLYTQKTLDIRYDSKVFDKSNNTIDRGTHYGKTVFVEKIVLPNTASIDFTGFVPMLNRLVAVLRHYKARQSNEKIAP